MSAIAAHYASSPDRRYPDLASSYDPSSFFSYPQPSLDGTYALTSSSSSSSSAAAPTSNSYVWDTHQSASYSASSSATLPLNPPSYSTSSSSSAHSGPSSLSAYPPDYPSHPHRSVLASRSTASPFLHVPSHSHSHSHSSNSALPPSSSSSSSSSASSSSSRSTYPSAPRPYSSLADAALSSSSPSSIHPPPRLQNAQWDHNALYTIEPSDTMSPPPASPDIASPSSPPIKEEDPDVGFVIEVSVPADQPLASPMPEVPLRATHAPPKMRKMMYSFRLENFAIHDGIRSAATQPGSGGIEVGPLREKPIELEWQLDLDPPLLPHDHHSDTALRYRPPPSIHSTNPARSPDIYRAISPASSRISPSASAARSAYPSAASPSPPLSVDYSPAVDSDSWDASSAYGSLPDSASASTPGMNPSPSFASVMTPAQSLGWNLRYNPADVDLADSATPYRRPASVQSSLSRVSQPHGQYMLSGSSSKSPYHQHQHQQASQYAYESTAFSSRGTSSSSRYPDAYASSTSSWYRSS